MFDYFVITSGNFITVTKDLKQLGVAEEVAKDRKNWRLLILRPDPAYSGTRDRR